ncbi:MAG: hypothetical protein SGI71_02665 [Verrucomicrobiota bacterium]|nr:hypothetical protein [Verrucomicrobiota bacterium]
MASLIDFNVLPVSILKKVIKIKEKIEKLEAQLASVVGGRSVSNSASTVAPVGGKKRGRKKGTRLSPSARAKIAEGQRQRWAKVRGSK